MKFLLDSNACINLLKSPNSPGGRRGQAIRAKLEQCVPKSDEHSGDVAVCSVVWMELVYGALRSDRSEDNLHRSMLLLNSFTSLPFDNAAAETAARLRVQLASSGQPIGPSDVLIAAIALANDLTLITHNTNEFGRVVDLRLEDWEAEK